MKNSILIAVVGIANAHNPQDTSVLQAKAHPATYKEILAVGESFHNAVMNCFDQTHKWLIYDQELKKKDAHFEFVYPSDYQLQDKIDSVYASFKTLLGEDNYFNAPNLYMFASDYEEPAEGPQGPEAPQAEAQTLAQIEAGYVIPDPFATHDDRDWIHQKKRPTPEPTKIDFYGGKNPDSFERTDDEAVYLHAMFSKINDIAHMCDANLEQAHVSLKRVGRDREANKVHKKRQEHQSQFKYVIGKQIAHIRWSYKGWTRYNIAESAIYNTQQFFEDRWNEAVKVLEDINAEKLATDELKWISDPYKDRLERYSARKDGWIQLLQDWVDACKNPLQEECDSEGILSLEKTLAARAEIADTYFKFFKPILDKIEDDDERQKQTNKVYEGIMSVGIPQSIRNEFTWLHDRVRFDQYIQNRALDAEREIIEDQFDEILKVREEILALLSDPANQELYGDAKDDEIFSETVLEEMTQRRDRMVNFLKKWSNGNKNLYDDDDELFRNDIRRITRNHSGRERKVKDWYFAIISKPLRSIYVDGVENRVAPEAFKASDVYDYDDFNTHYEDFGEWENFFNVMEYATIKRV